MMNAGHSGLRDRKHIVVAAGNYIHAAQATF